MGNRTGGSVIANVPFNPNFNYYEWAEYRQKAYGDAKWIWGPDPGNIPYQLLPGNMDIFDLLIYAGSVLETYLTRIHWAGENILYTPGFPDIIYTSFLAEGAAPITADSPHIKIPYSISYQVRKRAPRSIDAPFGTRKNWKFRSCGEFQDTSGNVWQLRSRWWENLVEFTTIARSGKEAEILCLFFEHFMDLNEGSLLEAGLAKMVPFGRWREPIVRLDQANVHYRTTLFWFLTQEFKYAGPINRISDIHMDVNPTLE